MMRSTAEKIEQLADRLDQNLRRVERSRSSMRMRTRCHLDVVLRECGIRRRGERNVALIETALGRRGIFASPPITDPAARLDQFLCFSRTPRNPDRPSRQTFRFPVERELENIVWPNFEYLFPNLKPLTPQYPLRSGSKVDTMATDKASGERVVMELKVAEQDSGTPIPDRRLHDELRAYEKGRNYRRAVRGIVIFSEPTPTITGHVLGLAAAHDFEVECFIFKVKPCLISAIGGSSAEPELTDSP